MNEEYAFWIHKRSGEVYAIRSLAGVVTGCCGPISERDRSREDLPDYHYDDSPEAAEWARDTEREFDLYEG